MPEGTPEGGEFAGNDGETAANSANASTDSLINQNVVLRDLTRTAQRKIARGVLRTRLIAGLRAIAGIAADAVPVAGEVFDAYEIAQTVADFQEIHIEADAAIDFVQGGPRDLETLRVSPEDQGFSSADAFKKDFVEKVFGSAGPGYDYHHIVWQGGPNARNIAPELLHSTENMIRVPRILHEAITDAYRRSSQVEGLNMREWLDTQPYEVQRAEGLKIMRDLGIIK